MNIRMTAEIVPDGQAFAVKIGIEQIPTLAQAQEIGAALNEAVSSYFDAKGANLVHDTSNRAAGSGRVILPS